jgi:hypothetical protein
MAAVARVLVAGAFSSAMLITHPADAQTSGTSNPLVVPQATSNNWPIDHRLLVVGVGAVVGAMAFNVLSAPLGTVPLAGGALETVPLSIALGSRLIGVVSAGAGALGATWLYDHCTGYRGDYSYALTLGAGAFAGVAVGNLLQAGMIGALPYYVGAGVADATGTLATPAAQAASRIYVIGSGVLGAWIADFLYRRETN